MAQDQAQPQKKASWTKIFTAFKVALDVKKLLLAAAGILLVAVGWWAIGWAFYGMRTYPEWKNFEPKEEADKEIAWRHFKARRASWNLMHELAGPPSDPRPVDAADVTDNLEEFKLVDEWDRAIRRLSEPISITNVKDQEATLNVPKAPSPLEIVITAANDASAKALPDLAKLRLVVGSIKQVVEEKVEKTQKDPTDPTKVIKVFELVQIVEIDRFRYTFTKSFKELKDYRDSALDRAQVEGRAGKSGQKAFKTFEMHLITPKYKPAGRLRVLPWFEDRGDNPYLTVSDAIKSPTEFVAPRGKFLDWLFTQQAPVVLEPLVKFFMPVAYFFDTRAGWWDRVYLLMILLWTVVVWGFFGGAICRIAAVQIARNERIPLAEALMFARERFVSYIAAPVFPIVLIGIFLFLLMLFGWVEWIPWFGDIFAGLFWPVVLLLGFIMAIVLIGLIGWPLMIATISTEGSDSFDALSRSYSYVYQAPWQYLWYNFLAVVYGAALIFFIGFMASLMVFLGKWGVSSAVGLSNPNPANDREPSYLFYFAPESFRWRDLLISTNQHVERVPTRLQSGRLVERLEFKKDYREAMSGANYVGAFLVAFWIYPFFLLVLGFGYSFFWSASTIIYFLMRQHVDDTEMDEVHMEDEDMEDPFMRPAPAAPPAPEAKPGTVSLNVVDAPPPPPPFTPPSSTSIMPDESPPFTPPPAPPESPPDDVPPDDAPPRTT